MHLYKLWLTSHVVVLVDDASVVSVDGEFVSVDDAMLCR